MEIKHSRKELDTIMREEEISEALATPLYCTIKCGFVKYEKNTALCTVDYDCMYKDDDRCMSLKYRR